MWRVVTSYVNELSSTNLSNDSNVEDILGSRPRALEFDERLHKSLNSELKYLYTAITRAKCNLWIYDADQNKRLPMFDYWVRCGLVNVIKMGEKEEDDQALFTATSTPEQWQHQGDFFKRKGLWEPAIKCYHKAGATLQEKETEAYLCAQKGRGSKVAKEMQEWFQKAAELFLICDHHKHSVKYLTNAAKCLKHGRNYSDAAKLFERLGQVRQLLALNNSLTFIFPFLFAV